MKPRLDIYEEDITEEIVKASQEERRKVNIVTGMLNKGDAHVSAHQTNRRRTNKYHGVQSNWNNNSKQYSNSFRARITIDKKLVHLGSFKTAEQAAKAYDKAAKTIYGSNAVLNFPKEQ